MIKILTALGGFLGFKVKLKDAPRGRKKRKLTLEQYAAAVERMAKARAAKVAKKQPKHRGRKPILAEDKIPLVRRLVNERKTEYEIAKELGCKPHNVTSFRRRHGITYLKDAPFTYKEDGITVNRFAPEYAEGVSRPKSVKAKTATPIKTKLELIADE